MRRGLGDLSRLEGRGISRLLVAIEGAIIECTSSSAADRGFGECLWRANRAQAVRLEASQGNRRPLLRRTSAEAGRRSSSSSMARCTGLFRGERKLIRHLSNTWYIRFRMRMAESALSATDGNGWWCRWWLTSLFDETESLSFTSIGQKTIGGRAPVRCSSTSLTRRCLWRRRQSAIFSAAPQAGI